MLRIPLHPTPRPQRRRRDSRAACCTPTARQRPDEMRLCLLFCGTARLWVTLQRRAPSRAADGSVAPGSWGTEARAMRWALALPWLWCGVSVACVIPRVPER
ncbi:hypothetical protein FA09DRAFT_70488 [Tilletiopsis washingtonensis]|uniref:Uncharacterized protein n=1 Tax=Tilletiopsis washingtonensis TaxID=58919 RepID=A0A316Z6G0_9BASI|nr:hypothetical protein FA09DRAFT_70488 [Tilletiopsis washingtonensis]PWN96866.1 hypothetical protein FA09DRAFT_70488 [Tilletiopsis washingtonensis]